jgi:LPS-assembly lipoprotein
MSSSSLPNARLRLWLSAGKAMSLAAALSLVGCVQPLYMATAEGGGAIGDELRLIKVEPIPDRLGHYVENELISQLNGTGSTPTPKYRLVVKLNERMSTPIINTFTGQAEAGAVNVNADYILFPIAGSEMPLATGTVTEFVAYDRTSQRLSNVRAARDAEIRNAKTIAEQIRTRIAIALAK